MVKWIEVENIFGEKFILNVANIQGYIRFPETNEYCHWCGSNSYTVSEETHDKIMDAVDEYCEEVEALLKKENSVAPVTNNITTGLNAAQVKLQILNCDFLNAEQKLKLIVTLGV